MIKDLANTGQQSAKEMYGARGWMAHHNTDIWRVTGAVDYTWGSWPTSNAWLSQHLWEKYLYSGDKHYLADVYPVMKSAVAFFEDFLIESLDKKWLIVSPSMSPENIPTATGTKIAAGVTMDNQLLRLLDGDRALKLMRDQISPAMTLDGSVNESGGTYPNMFDAHPPFQIDGNFGFTSGMAEMLAQSHDGAVHLLPALPQAWPEGNAKGLMMRGGFVVDMCWTEGQVRELKIHSRLGGNLRLRTHSPLPTVKGFTAKTVRGDKANTNGFYQQANIKTPRKNTDKVMPVLSLANTYVIDVATKAGQDYHWSTK